ncbi:hypothetical protein Tco_1015791 [Tanacetum coccineum]|uniref:Uncharacterized protein n=1 Tax=Tanacetum coccineum TaxID=301880 RepID=A0ABQ5FLS9_9ASTR
MKATMAWRCRACDDLVKDYLCVPYDLPVVEPNQPDAILIIPESVLVDEDEDPKEEEFEEEEEPQEKEEDMEVDPFNPPSPASESEPEDVIEVEDTVEPEDETVLLVSIRLLHFRDDCVVARRRMHWSKRKGKQRMSIMLGDAKERAECKKLKKELEEARFTNKLLLMQNERVERDLYWTRVQAHEFYREMIRRGFLFEERPNEAIDVPVEDEKSLSSEPRGSPPLNQAAVRQMIKENVDAAIAAELARHANARYDARGS